MSAGKMLGLIFLIGFSMIQLIPVERSNPKSDPALEIKAPTEVKEIFERSCYDCHSNKTRWPWYSNIAPMKWFIARDVRVGRQWLNFSEWESYDEAKKKKLKEMIFTAIGLAMPLGMYVQAHPQAKLSPEDREKIREWTGIKPEDIMNNPKRRLY
ncbi:heme-binding domain-containing protein [Hydrogenimonas cancrithermarum]|uniref:Heme-binding protein n=1 Tax=Hydrogenimonas cancrithermarum TaxID=2993563 RepID=A0ABM8FMB6_9BACT|nr:heme-binding domain-containing protein [Hydrogenimonas cancrithermarum]BDY12895.1 heme-binding protein [Hydrogenimonas cancrithermarum]BDY13012.1 heme-binding protein [Hydrogenimonas cancrithermarum]